MIDEHRLLIAPMSFLAAYFAVLLIVAAAAFVSYRHDQMYLNKGHEKDQADEDGDPR